MIARDVNLADRGTQKKTGTDRRLWVALSLTLVLGFVLGRASLMNTRATFAAVTAECGTPIAATPMAATPVPTATATPIPATPSSAGETVAYGDGWQVTVLSIAPVASGQAKRGTRYIRLNLEIVGIKNSAKVFPFNELRLVDENGLQFPVDTSATVGLFGPGQFFAFQPGIAETRSVVFTIPSDDATSFILESSGDPTYQVALNIGARG